MQTNYSPNSNHVEKRPVADPYQLTRDPIFYITVAFFALLTTGLPGLMGQPTLMPMTQAIALTLFTAIPLRRREVGTALGVVALWISVQILVLVALTWLAPTQIERAIPDGFAYSKGLVQWFYTGDPWPRTLLAAPLATSGEVAGILLGSLLTGGLVGGWFLVRAANLFAYALGTLAREIGPGPGLLAGLAPWRLLSLAGYAGFFVLLAQPILTNRWHPGDYGSAQRRLVVGSASLLIAGLVLELVLPGLWRAVLGASQTSP